MTTKHIVYMAIAITLLCLTGVLSVAAAGISGVSPAEGTVGTAMTISGSGFGAKAGQVLLGDELCKVVAWSDTRIDCTVSKPQLAGTVHHHGHSTASPEIIGTDDLLFLHHQGPGDRAGGAGP